MDFAEFIKTHISYKTADEIARICCPLFETFSINYFDYARVYQDHTCLHLTSHRDGYFNYIYNHYPIAGTVVPPGIHLWTNFMSHQAITENKNHFNFNHGITFCKHREEYIEFFDLAAPSDNPLIFETYFNHTDLLEKFILYFKDKANPIIEQAYQERFSLPDKMQGNILTPRSYTQFCNLIKTNRIHLNLRAKHIVFTKREYEILQELAKGKTAKESAKTLNISPRTVEAHLENAKNKTQCAFKSEIIDLFREAVFF